MLNDAPSEAVEASKKSFLEDDNGGGNGEPDSSPTESERLTPSNKPSEESFEGILAFYLI